MPNNFKIPLPRLLHALPILVAVLNEKGVIVDVNSKAESWLEFKREDLIGQRFDQLQIFDDKTRKALIEKFAQRMSGQQLEPYTIEFYSKSGKKFWGEINGTLVKDEKTGEARNVAFVSNMSDLKREEQVLYRQIFDNMASGVAVYQPIEDGQDFVFVDYNPAGQKIDQTSKEQTIDKKVTEVFPGVHEMGIFKIFQEVNKTGKTMFFPMRQYKDEKLASWRNNVVFKLPDGKIAAIYDDVTKQKQYEIELKESEAKYHGYIDNAPDGIFVANEEGKFLEINLTAIKMFGYSQEEFQKMTIRDIHDQSSQKAGREAFKALKTKGKDTKEFLFKKKNGETFMGLMSAIKLSDTRYMEFLKNISQRKKLEQQLKEKINELERINKIMVGRELKMIELKQELKDIK